MSISFYNGVELDEFTVHYLTCMLWAETDWDSGDSLDDNYNIGDCSAELLMKAKEDCEKFQNEVSWKDETNPWNSQQGGHDLWLTRGGHGVGFWSRDWKELKLDPEDQERVEKFGTLFDDIVNRDFPCLDVYVGDGKTRYLYFS